MRPEVGQHVYMVKTYHESGYSDGATHVVVRHYRVVSCGPEVVCLLDNGNIFITSLGSVFLTAEAANEEKQRVEQSLRGD